MKKNITTLEELEKEQQKLKMMMEITRQKLASNLGTNRKQLKQYLLKNVALPVGAVGAGIAAVNVLSADKRKKTKVNPRAVLFKKLFSLGLNVLQAYLVKQRKQRSIASRQLVAKPDPSIAKKVA